MGKREGILLNFNLLENGIDSLRQAKINIDENYLNHEFETFQLKDGLFNCTHGIEILAKFIIKENNEEDIFAKKEEYRLAKKAMKEHHNNVFEVNSRLRTISAIDALKLLKNKFSLGETEYHNAVSLIKTRDSLMHYTVIMDNKKKEKFAEDLRNCIDQMTSYFSSYISDFVSKLEELERFPPYTEYNRWEDAEIDVAEARYEEGRLEIY